MSTVRGLELSRKFYEECGKKLIASELADLEGQIAAGLVGEGSECFGFDDDISRDHDWGPAFCLWLPEDVLVANAERIEKALSGLPESFEGFRGRMKPEERMGRVGPMPIEGFYRRFLNVPSCPKTLGEWRAIPEHYLAVATNGMVFCDPLGKFSAIREELLRFYPEDLRLKKIAARCVAAAQAGQYNLPRMMARHFYTAVSICSARFTEAVISMLYLLNKKYMPFYKWAHAGLAKIGSPLAEGVGASLEQLCCLTPLENTASDYAALIEDICQRLADELVAQGLSDSNDPWLYEQGPTVQARIQHEGLRRLPVQFD